jgi:hypothetical protein
MYLLCKNGLLWGIPHWRPKMRSPFQSVKLKFSKFIHVINLLSLCCVFPAVYPALILWSVYSYNYITSVFHWNVTIWLVMKWSNDYKRDVLHPNIFCIISKNWMNFFVVLLTCKSVDRSTLKKNVPPSTILHAYKTTQKCIQFL